MVGFAGEVPVESFNGRRRRLWSEEAKRRIVAETLEPGASVSVVARRHDLNANMLFTWRRAFAVAAAGGGAMTLVPATITAESTPTLPRVPRAEAGRMEIVVAGGARVLVGADVDAAALARVVKALSRR